MNESAPAATVRAAVGVAETLCEQVTAGTVERLLHGPRFVMAIVRTADGERRAGLANTCGHGEPLPASFLQRPAAEVARRLLEEDPRRAAEGLATINALCAPKPVDLEAVDVVVDGADWLSAVAEGRRVALVGRFPFIEDELRPAARQLWVSELDPRPGELDPPAMAEVLPRADIVAITGSTLVNHTLDGILRRVAPEASVLLLGPSTTLSGSLAEHGVDRVSGVLVEDIDGVAQQILRGVGFRHLRGLRRVSLVCRKTVGGRVS